MAGRYEPCRQRNEFRVLVLHAGRRDDPLAGELVVSQLSKDTVLSITFAAVSYVWGSDQPRHEMSIGGWRFLVRDNLWHFLLQIRDPINPITLWIDAVCIDQRNLKERSVQVEMMGLIYRSAAKVLVWLGHGYDDSDGVMRRIVNWTQAHDSDEDRSLVSWIQRPYWTRTWVVQEFLLARDLIIMCGTEEIRWHHLSARFDIISEVAVGRLQLRDQPALNLFRQRINGKFRDAPLLQLLIKNQWSECQDPRDKVYAMLSLASDCQQGRKIEVDYSGSGRALFLRLIAFLDPAPGDAFRVARFIRELLKLELASISTFPSPVRVGSLGNRQRQDQHGLFQTKSKGQQNLLVRGTRTGTIKDAQQLAKDNPLNMESQTTDSVAESFPKTDTQFFLQSLSYGPKITRVSDITSQIQKLDQATLKSPANMLNGISHRSWIPEIPDKALRDNSMCFSIVQGYFSEYKTKALKVGLGFGHIQQEDFIVEFSGYELAFTVVPSPRSRYSGSIIGDIDSHPSYLITGRVAFVEPAGPWSDRLTRRPMWASAIETEAECANTAESLTFHLSPQELLVLVR